MNQSKESAQRLGTAVAFMSALGGVRIITEGEIFEAGYIHPDLNPLCGERMVDEWLANCIPKMGVKQRALVFEHGGINQNVTTWLEVNNKAEAVIRLVRVYWYSYSVVMSHYADLREAAKLAAA
jgi:hypothetical protein